MEAGISGFMCGAGRATILNITGIGKNFLKLRSDIIKIIKKINWKGGFYRRDIGWRVIGR